MKRLYAFGLLLTFTTVNALAQAPVKPPAGGETVPGASKTEQEQSQEVVNPFPPAPPELIGQTRFQGKIVNIEGTLLQGTKFSVEVAEWGTPEQIKEFKKILAEEGQAGLIKRLSKSKQVGYLKVGETETVPIFAARAIAAPGGYIIRAVTSKNLTRDALHLDDYPFGVIEMIVPSDGKAGHGTIVAVAKVGFDATGHVQMEGYGSLPAKLSEVAIEKPSK